MKELHLANFNLLTGCAYFNANSIAPGYFQAYQAIKNAIVGYENTLITPELIENSIRFIHDKNR